MLYASELAVQALGVPLEGGPWAGEPTKCACCAKVVMPGDIAVRDKDRFMRSFMSAPSLAAKGSGAVCGSCTAMFSAKTLMALQHAVITKDGAYTIRKDVHRSWFLLTPPEPPWVAVVSDTQQAHLVWHTPVTLDNNLMTVRLGSRLLQIRRPVLNQALKDAQLAADALIEVQAARVTKGGKAVGGSDDLRHPFLFLGRDVDDMRFGEINKRLYEHRDALRRGAPLFDAIARLNQLGIGELWAMATLAKRKREEPERPEKITLEAEG